MKRASIQVPRTRYTYMFTLYVGVVVFFIVFFTHKGVTPLYRSILPIIFKFGTNITFYNTVFRSSLLATKEFVTLVTLFFPPQNVSFWEAKDFFLFYIKMLLTEILFKWYVFLWLSSLVCSGLINKKVFHIKKTCCLMEIPHVHNQLSYWNLLLETGLVFCRFALFFVDFSFGNLVRIKYQNNKHKVSWVNVHNGLFSL